MSNTTILMALTFFGIFFTFLTYNYITTLVVAGTFSKSDISCMNFSQTIDMFQHPSFEIPKVGLLQGSLTETSTQTPTEISKGQNTCSINSFGVMACYDSSGTEIDLANVICDVNGNTATCQYMDSPTKFTAIVGELSISETSSQISSQFLQNIPGLREISNFFRNIYNFVAGIIEKVVNLVGWLGGIGASFIVIFTTSCPMMIPLKWILGAVFLPMIIGLSYIIIRLIKSMIPTVGGD